LYGARMSECLFLYGVCDRGGETGGGGFKWAAKCLTGEGRRIDRQANTRDGWQLPVIEGD
jgi:hypothetical protein